VTRESITGESQGQAMVVLRCDSRMEKGRDPFGRRERIIVNWDDAAEIAPGLSSVGRGVGMWPQKRDKRVKVIIKG